MLAFVAIFFVIGCADASHSASSETPTVGEKTYSISFDANGGSGTMSPLNAAKDASVPLTACSFASPTTGMTFGGWMTGASGTSVAYEDGSSYAMGDSDVTLYAFWGTPEASVTAYWNYNSGPGGATSQTTYTSSSGAYSFFRVYGLSSGEYHEKTFTIKNTGTGNLHLTGSPRVAISSDAHAAFSVITQPLEAILPGKTSVVVVRCTTDGTADSRYWSASMGIPNDSSNWNSISIYLYGGSC